MNLSKDELLKLVDAPSDRPWQSVTWLLPADTGGSVRAVLQWDSEQGTLTAEAVESGRNGRVVLAWVSASYRPEDDTFEVTGEDATGEGGDETDPRAAAAAFRRQVAGIKASSLGRVVYDA